ncbi:MAG: cell division protein SepF [Candidatus Limivicinus sp.]|jgi:cell division inhibitor SepF
MGFMDELRKLTQPYDDEDDFFEGADPSFRPKPKQPAETAQPQPPSREEALFENTFADDSGYQQPPRQPVKRQKPQKPRRPLLRPQQAAPPPPPPAEGSIFGNLGGQKKPQRKERTVNFGGRDAQVILFSPKTFDEAGEIVGHLSQRHSVVMTLEGLPVEMARRLLDFISGIAFALQGKITPVSAKTYFVTPQNVDIVGAQPEQPESDGQYF